MAPALEVGLEPEPVAVPVPVVPVNLLVEEADEPDDEPEKGTLVDIGSNPTLVVPPLAISDPLPPEEKPEELTQYIRLFEMAAGCCVSASIPLNDRRRSRASPALPFTARR